MTLSLRHKIYLLFGWALLLTAPGLLLVRNYSLFPLIELDSVFSQVLYWLTSMGTAPYGVLSVLILLVICYQKIPSIHFMPLLLTVSLSMVSSLGLNHFLKSYFSEPRPNAQLMADKHLLDLNEFYRLEAAQRKPIIAEAIKLYSAAPSNPQLSSSVANHWRNEVGFAFPSGHTLFAVTLSMVMSYFLLLGGHYLLPSLLWLWSLGMGFSRMLLGMHWSQDVLASTVLGGLIGLASIWCIISGSRRSAL